MASGPHTSGRKSVPKWQLGLLGLAVVISIALIAVGAIIPKIVESTIKTTVQDTVLLDVQGMKAAGQNKFYNSSSPMDFFLYSCTNLYDVLTDATGVTRPNFKEVGPFNLIRYQSKYDVVYNEDRTMVSYKQLTTFQVADAATAALLDTPIIGPNPLHFGMGQQIMQMGLQGVTGKVTSLFPNNLLSDQQTHVGAMAGLLLPLVFNVFTDPSDVLLTGMRAQSMLFYLGTARFMSGAAGGWAAVKEAWARGTPLLSAVPNPTYAALFEGFELNPTGVEWVPLLPRGNLTSTNLVDVANKVLDVEHPETSLAAPKGFAKWAAILTELQKGQVGTDAQTAMSNALGLGDAGAERTDFGRIITWILSLISPIMPSGAANPFYAAYQRGCMAGIGGQVQEIAATGSNTTKATYANYADFQPASWEDLGALQFGSGFMVGLALNQTAFLETGAGKSFRDLSPTAITDFELPMNFQNRATPTWGGMEPPEFVSGLRYYVDHCVLPATSDAAQADTRQLWDTDFNPFANLHLLFVQDSSNPTQRTTLIPLTIAQSKKLIAALTNPTTTGDLFTALNVMVQFYAAGYGGVIAAAQAGTADPNDAIPTGYAYAGQVLAGAVNFPTPTSPAVDFSPVLLASGVTITNFFAIYTYMASYLFNELAGPLSLLDPATGLAPQNTGLFTQRTAREMLFGYTSRFGPDFMVPGIAGVETDWSLHSERIKQDRLKKQDKDIVQYTGKGDFERIGQFVKYAGVSQYQSYCDLFDPTRINNDTCATAAVRAVYDEDLYTSPLSISGTGDGMNQGPLHEGDDEIVPVYTLYVDEAKRSLPLVYNMTHKLVRDIEMRRYRVGEEPLVGDNYYRNKTQLRFNDDKQVPNGFTSVQSVTGGIPLLLGLPRFGPMVDSNFDAGVTCSAADDSPGHRCQDTYVDSEHGTWIDVEPITGMTMYGRKRLQANFRTSKTELYTDLTNPLMQGINYHYNNMFKAASWDSNPNMILPYYWADLHDMLKDKDVKDFNDAKDAMAAGRNMGKIVHIAGITVGAVGVFASVGALIFLMARK